MRRPAVAAALLAVLLASCATKDRPEGAVERWLLSINQGAAGEPEKYAPAAITDMVLPGWEDCDPGALDVVEVGRGVVVDATARVPYRVEGAAGAGSLCDREVPEIDLEGVAVLERRGGEWTVVALAGPQAGLEVPSEGGRRIGAASATAWATGVAVGLGLALLTTVLMALFGRHPTAASRAVEEQLTGSVS